VSITEADRALYEVMTSMSRRVRVPASNPYEIGLDAMGDIARSVIDTAGHGGGAYLLWAELTDVADHPRTAGPRWCDALTRLAAGEWLAVDTEDDDAVAGYFDRWQDPLLRTQDLLGEPDSGWRPEYYDFLDRTMRGALADTADQLASADQQTVARYLDDGEYGLALEYVALVLCEDEVPVPAVTLKRLGHVAEMLSSDQAMRDLAEIPAAEDAGAEGARYENAGFEGVEREDAT